MGMIAVYTHYITNKPIIPPVLSVLFDLLLFQTFLKIFYFFLISKFIFFFRKVAIKGVTDKTRKTAKIPQKNILQVLYELYTKRIRFT
jgi:hypothetical protein